jgi:hypothetical protein
MEKTLAKQLNKEKSELSQFDDPPSTNLDVLFSPENDEMTAYYGTLSNKIIKDISKIHLSQTTKISNKAEEEIHLADLMKDFFKKKTELETAFYKDMEKLLKSFIQKSVALVPTKPTGEIPKSASLTFTLLTPSSTGTMTPTDARKFTRPELSRDSSPMDTNSQRPITADRKASIGEYNQDGYLPINKVCHWAFHSLLIESDKTIKAKMLQNEKVTNDICNKIKELSKVKSGRTRKVKN